jgi:hypothetical protein
MKSYYVSNFDLEELEKNILPSGRPIIKVFKASEVRDEIERIRDICNDELSKRCQEHEKIINKLCEQNKKDTELRKRWFKQKLINDLKPIKVKKDDFIPIHLSDIDEAFTKPTSEIEMELK